MPPAGTIALAVVAALGAALYAPVHQRLTTLGVLRPLNDKFKNIRGHEIKVITNAAQCEDLHYHPKSGLIYTACQKGSPQDRTSWFPPLCAFADPSKAELGGLFVIDPKTFTSTELKIEGFNKLFTTHGIDIIADPKDPSVLHIFAVNHVPNVRHYSADDAKRRDAEPKAASRIEIFTHEIGSKTATWRRSVVDPLIETPNDIYATSPTSFFVTNDHYYRKGPLRGFEGFATELFAPWTTTIHTRIQDIDEKSDPSAGQVSHVALRGLHNNNGLGRGSPNRPSEVIIGDAGGGVIFRAERIDADGSQSATIGASSLRVVDRIQMESNIDNPSFYTDPYANATDDASGYIIAGLARGIDISHWADPDVPIPTIVWHIRANNKATLDADGTHRNWEKRLVWQDNGESIRSASAAVLVPIDPQKNGGKKQGWLFISGFASAHVVASRIDL